MTTLLCVIQPITVKLQSAFSFAPERSEVTLRAFQDRQYGSLEVWTRLQLVWPSASTCPHYSTAKTDSTFTHRRRCGSWSLPLVLLKVSRRLTVQLRLINWALHALIISINLFREHGTSLCIIFDGYQRCIWISSILMLR